MMLKLSMRCLVLGAGSESLVSHYTKHSRWMYCGSIGQSGKVGNARLSPQLPYQISLRNTSCLYAPRLCRSWCASGRPIDKSMQLCTTCHLQFHSSVIGPACSFRIKAATAFTAAAPSLSPVPNPTKHNLGRIPHFIELRK